MSVIEAFNDNFGDVPPQVVRAFVEDLAGLASRLPPEAQARLMGFVHLAANPDSVQAELDVSGSGEVCLVLRQPAGT